LFNAVAVLESRGVAVSASARKAIGRFVSQQTDDAFAQLVSALGEDLEEEKQLEMRDAFERCLIDEKKRHTIEDLPSIASVVKDFDFFVQEKWRIAIDRPGSGNTKNIGSATAISELKTGTALFTKHENGEEMFNDYWQYYLTKDMARAIDSTPPYKNIETYLDYKQRALSS
jgi:hypothetical protein